MCAHACDVYYDNNYCFWGFNVHIFVLLKLVCGRGKGGGKRLILVKSTWGGGGGKKEVDPCQKSTWGVGVGGGDRLILVKRAHGGGGGGGERPLSEKGCCHQSCTRSKWFCFLSEWVKWITYTCIWWTPMFQISAVCLGSWFVQASPTVLISINLYIIKSTTRFTLKKN